MWRPRLTDACVLSAMITRSPATVPTRRPKDAESSSCVSRRRRISSSSGGAAEGASVQDAGAPVVGRYDGLGIVGVALWALEGT